MKNHTYVKNTEAIQIEVLTHNTEGLMNIKQAMAGNWVMSAEEISKLKDAYLQNIPVILTRIDGKKTRQSYRTTAFIMSDRNSDCFHKKGVRFELAEKVQMRISEGVNISQRGYNFNQGEVYIPMELATVA